MYPLRLHKPEKKYKRTFGKVIRTFIKTFISTQWTKKVDVWYPLPTRIQVLKYLEYTKRSWTTRGDESKESVYHLSPSVISAVLHTWESDHQRQCVGPQNQKIHTQSLALKWCCFFTKPTVLAKPRNRLGAFHAAMEKKKIINVNLKLGHAGSAQQWSLKL